MDRHEKLNFIKGIMSGKIKVPQPFSFICFITYTKEPGMYYHNGQPMTEEEKNNMVAYERSKGLQVWEEVLTY